MDVVNPLAQDANVNTGLKQRHAYKRESKSVAMEGRIHSDLFARDRYILGAVPTKIKLVRSRNPFCLVTSAENPNFKVVIEECLFRVRRVNVAQVLYLLIPSPFNKPLPNTQSIASIVRSSPYLGGTCLEINLIYFKVLYQIVL
jgi:hypothetical protein